MARILLVDDEKNIRKTVSMALKADGHGVELASDGIEGLERFGEGHNFDLVLTDQRMPGLVGERLAVEIRERAPEVKIIMMTAFASPELVVKMLETRASDFLRKPFALVSLRRAVQSALRRSSAERDLNVATLKTPQGVSFAINGFEFSPDQGYAHTLMPPGIDLARGFTIRGGENSQFHTVVGLTPHLHDSLCAEIGYDYTTDSAVWDYLCEQILSFYLWQHGDEDPPDLIPVYDLSTEWMYRLRRFATGDV